MKTKRHSTPDLVFPTLLILCLCVQTGMSQTASLGAANGTWNPSSQNQSGNQNVTEANTTSSLNTTFSSTTTTAEAQNNSLGTSPTTAAQTPTSSPTTSALSGTGGSSSTTKSSATKERCEDNKSLVLICFIVIAVLVLICTFLFLSTIVVANKMSYLKKTQQGKRRPRSNGDLLATNSFWPTAAGTWQRMPREASGTELIMQELIAGRDAASPGKNNDEASEKLTKEKGGEWENKDSKLHKPIVTNFVSTT
ncbi:EVI2A protein, partial [Turnix velox]|nr:EVI2A protein [Turnix velox]